MFCGQCGQKIDDDAKFCPFCGAPVERTPDVTPVPKPNPPSQTGSVQGGAGVGGGMGQRPQSPKSVSAGRVASPYYIERFRAIRAGEKGGFNAISLIGGPFQQMTHGSMDVFLKTYLAPYAVLLAACLLTIAGSLAENGTLRLVGLVLCGAAAVLFLVMGILNALSYNQKLFEKTGGNPEAIPNKPVGGILLGVGTAVLVVATAAVFFTHGGFGGLSIPSGSSGSKKHSETKVVVSAAMGDPDRPWAGAWRSSWGSVVLFDDLTADSGKEKAKWNKKTETYDITFSEEDVLYRCDAAGSWLDCFDESGEEFYESYSRPVSGDAYAPLPELYWGYWEPKNSRTAEPVIVDAFRCRDGLYEEAIMQQSSAEGTLEYEVVLRGSGVGTRYVLTEENGELVLRIGGDGMYNEYTTQKSGTVPVQQEWQADAADSTQEAPQDPWAVFNDPFPLYGVGDNGTVTADGQPVRVIFTGNGEAYIEKNVITRNNTLLRWIGESDGGSVCSLALVEHVGNTSAVFGGWTECAQDGMTFLNNGDTEVLMRLYYSGYLEAINNQDLSQMHFSTEANSMRLVSRITNPDNTKNWYDPGSCKVTMDRDSLMISSDNRVMFNATFEYDKTDRKSNKKEHGSNHQSVMLVWQDGMWQVEYCVFVSNDSFKAHRLGEFK